MAESVGRKVLVVGLDSMDWEFVNRHTDIFPNIVRMKEKGAWGELGSTIPPLTAPAWVSFATGRNPGGHGCFGFTLPGANLNQANVVSSRSIAAPTIYQVLEKAGIPSILINLPVSYPPLTSQVTITSILTRGDECVFPLGLRKKFAELADYRILPDPSLAIGNDLDAYFHDIRRVEAIRFRAASRLYDSLKWGFFFVLFTGSDLLLHRRDSRTSDFHSQEAWTAFREMDSYVGWFLDRCLASNGTTMFLMSDHGCAFYDGYAFLNEWLRRRGYLKAGLMRKTPAGHLMDEQKARIRARRSRELGEDTMRIVNSSPLSQSVAKALLSFNSKLLRPLGLDLAVQEGAIPDASDAYVFSPSSGGIYMNTRTRFTGGVVGDQEYEPLRESIIDALGSLKDHKGRRVFSCLEKRERVYSGSQVGQAPDIVFQLSHYMLDTGVGDGLFLEHGKSSHSMTGLLSIAGDGMPEGIHISDARIVDLAPTILGILGVQPPMTDGKDLVG